MRLELCAVPAPIQRAQDRFYRWAALPGDRWENRERQLHGSVVGIDRDSIRLEILPAAFAVEPLSWPELPGDSSLIETIKQSDRGWRPVP